MRITSLISPRSQSESFGGKHLRVAHVGVNVPFRIALHVQRPPYNFLYCKLEYALFYASNEGHAEDAAWNKPSAQLFSVGVHSATADSCTLTCRLFVLTSKCDNRYFILRIRLAHPTDSDQFLEVFTMPLRTWSKTPDKKTALKRPREVTTPPAVSLETALSTFLELCDDVTPCERPAKIRRLVDALPPSQQTLASDVGFFLAQREAPPPLPWQSPSTLISSPNDSCDLLNFDVDSFFVG